MPDTPYLNFQNSFTHTTLPNLVEEQVVIHSPFQDYYLSTTGT
jgi:hypothetical protein